MLLTLLLLLLCICGYVEAFCTMSNAQQSRRAALATCLAPAVVFGSAVAAATAAETSKPRLKGAAELDLEYYLKDLLTGNALDPAMKPAVAPAAARLLDGDLVRGLQALTVQQIAAASAEATSTVSDVQALLVAYIEKVAPSFQRKAAFPPSDLTNQYNFDMVSNHLSTFYVLVCLVVCCLRCI
jgi:hypothetical protein